MDNILTEYRSFWICLALTLATTAVFYQVYTHDFISYDDNIYVYENQNIQSGITPKAIKWAFTTSHASNWHPLTWLSHMLDCQLFGLEPGGHHLSSVLLHIANTLLLFAVLRQLTGAIWRSAFVAAVFAVHPLNIESVAWIAERRNVLCTTFWILTMAGYLRYTKRPAVGSYLLALLAFALGLLVKQMVVTLPFVLLLLDYWPLARVQFGSDHQNKRFQLRIYYRLVLEKVPFFVLSAISCVTIFVLQRTGGVMADVEEVPFGPRISNAFVSYAKYISKMFRPSGLTIFYPYQKIPLWQAVSAALLLVTASVLIIRLARRRKYLTVGWLWYVGSLVPVIGLVQVGGQALADRYCYIPLIGLFIIIAWSLPDLLPKWRYKKIALGLSATLIILALSISTYFQLRHWRSNITLFQHAIDVTDKNYVAHCSLADAVRRQHNFSKAVYHNQEALRFRPDYLKAHMSLGLVLLEAGRFDEAIRQYKKVVQIDPNSAGAHMNLGKAFSRQGRTEEAVKEYREFLRMLPDNPDGHDALGTALATQGKLDEAITHFTEAIRIKPDFAGAHTNLGYALALQGNIDEAVAHLAEAVRLDPQSALAHYHLAQTLAQTGKMNEAIALFEKAHRLEPAYVDPINALAWYLATYNDDKIRNPTEAIQLAQRACELTDYKESNLLDTLAAAYAAAGKFSKAIEMAEEALELCQSSEQNTLKEEIKNRLLLYKAGKSYIEAR